MSYIINPQISYLDSCNTIKIYNDIFSNRVAEEGTTETLSAITCTIFQYGDPDRLTSTIQATSVNGVWGTLSTSDLQSWRVYPTTGSPTNGQDYSIRITYEDASIENVSYPSASSEPWSTILTNLSNQINAIGDSTSTYNADNTSLYIYSGNKEITSVEVILSNSDLSVDNEVNPDLVWDNGVYQLDVTYTLSDATVDTRTYYLAIYCSIEQCILRLVSRIPELIKCKKCQDECVDYIIESDALLESVRTKEINNLEDITEVEQTITVLESICENEDCQCYG